MTPRDLVGHAYDELEIGQTASFERVCTDNDLVVFAHASGNLNPRHLPGLAEKVTGEKPVAPAMWGGSLFSALLGNVLPGPGTAYLHQTLNFHSRVHAGDRLSVTVTVREKRADRRVILECRLLRDDGTLIADGMAEVKAPATRVQADDILLPALALQKGGKFVRLLAACAGVPAMPTAVVAPTDHNSLDGAWEAAKAGLIEPILVGPEPQIRAAAEALGWDLSGVQLVATTDEHAAPARAVALVHEGVAAALMKGNIHSDEVLKHVTKGDGGLRAGRRISHVFVLDVPGREGLMLISDAAINIAPDLMTKADIVQNAIDLAHAIGLPLPKVGILSAVETVNPAIPSTLDAAILSKMADRGQIKGGIVDGPLAMDNAVDVGAAKTKGIVGMVAGHADVLIAPNLESGNMLAKQLVFLSDAETGGLVVGARAPVMLTSRADDAQARLMSAALAVLYSHWKKTGQCLVAAGPES
ncbi:bifunctional enoyl-CoA hydratase/phosphate acetyltransferase [Falsiroseomonas selenitidurans]|uniref:Bifunctional enoyl-CoA hydratase/phosphate acetyltransferase n=1 Tax=Falsiroseomonas selenitidurans TaxID=2716335 RepID=A0ABX1E1Y1_9PROT|nr:bifunctional enoyl-CoA hydratase/phosphate acetyltransferase [Falsiroseomonas selenitidurans]NKC31169.1 bifunctional enoyl-CoA hydratase/phosphate acetyltransferase [Falsiroseomonas selenitidurans]